MSPCRSDHIFIRIAAESGMWPLRVLFRVFPADCPHFKIFTAFRRVLEDTRRFQHIAKLLTSIARRSPPYFNLSVFDWSNGRLKLRIAPHQNYPPGTVPIWFSYRLETAQCKSGISLATPRQPRPSLQSLPPMLRIQHTAPIPSCSKAPGVFSSNYR